MTTCQNTSCCPRRSHPCTSAATTHCEDCESCLTDKLPCISSALFSGCTVTIDRSTPSADPINLSEIQLFNVVGAQIPSTRLSLSMSSQHPSFPGANCLDGSTSSFCQTGNSSVGQADSNPTLRVSYTCSEGLSRVDVFNRQGATTAESQRILQVRIRAQNAAGTDLVQPFTITAVREYYAVPLGE